MANAGYLLLSRGYSARKEDIQWKRVFGCDNLVEKGFQEKIVLTRQIIVLIGIREFRVFLDPSREYIIHLAYMHDRIDSKNELFPETRMEN